jgi:hypothetical protein
MPEPKRKVRKKKVAKKTASSRAPRKASKKKAPPVDAKTMRLAELIHDALTGKEPVPVVVSQEEYLEMFEILGLLSRNAKGRDVSTAARSKDKLERMAAAMHPAATRGTLELLANDPESLIQSQAMKRLVEIAS